MASPYRNFPETRIKRAIEMQNRQVEQKKELIDRSMGASMRALDRECAELRKKRDELDHAKYNTSFLSADQDNRPISRSYHGTAGNSRINMAATSNRQLQKLYGSGAASPDSRKVCFEKSQHKMAKPGTSTGQSGQPSTVGSTLENPPSTSKGKGKGKGLQKDRPTPPSTNNPSNQVKQLDSGKQVDQRSESHATRDKPSTVHHHDPPDSHHHGMLPHSRHQNDMSNHSDHHGMSNHSHHHHSMSDSHHGNMSGSHHHGLSDSHHRGLSDNHHHGMSDSQHHGMFAHSHYLHEDAAHHSDQHDSHVSGKHRDEVEEQQKVLDLFIHLVEKVDDAVFDPADLKAKLKLSTQNSTSHHNTTAEKMKEKHHHHSGHAGPAGVLQRPPLPHLARLSEDPALLKDLEDMLEENKRLTKRKSRDLEHTVSRDSFTGSKTSLSRGKRRLSNLDMLADILEAYKAQYKDVNFDPLVMLNCSYLRLSKSNVEELERMCREKGIDPGLHAHSDVQDFRLFDDKEDAEGEVTAARLEVQDQTLARKKGSHQHIYTTAAKPK